MKTLEERFLAKVDKNGPNGCWLWTSPPSNNGYGQFGLNGTVVGAHRVAMLLFRGLELTPGRAMNLDHLCRNRLCVNPEHLEYVPMGENVRRAREANGRITHCRRGHEYTEQNTGHVVGARYCRACHAENERNRRRQTKRAPHART